MGSYSILATICMFYACCFKRMLHPKHFQGYSDIAKGEETNLSHPPRVLVSSCVVQLHQASLCIPF